MAFLADLNVKKVSFVSRAANKRKFLLLKSDEPDKQVKEEKQPNTAEETNIMLKEEIQKSVRLLLKTGLADEKIVETIKAEHSLKDAEVEELKGALSIARSMAGVLAPESKPDVKKSDPKDEDDEPEPGSLRKEVSDLRKQNDDLRESIRKEAEDRSKREIRVWLSEDCPYLTADATQMVEDIFKMSQTNPEGVQRFKDSLKASSDAIKNSALLTELGSPYDANPVPTGDILLKKIRTNVDEIKKGASNIKESDAIIQAVKGMGPAIYTQYRHEHIQRSKRLG